MSAWWREWATAAAFSTELQNSGELCLNEVVANIVQHGGQVRTIDITFEVDTDGVRMTIADDGKPFNPATYSPAPLPRTLDEATPGGLGITIMRGFAARLAYDRIDNRNRLSVTLTR
jgi:anti-sigma regulatory factor (Ser/Thr protein kinase)